MLPMLDKYAIFLVCLIFVSILYFQTVCVALFVLFQINLSMNPEAVLLPFIVTFYKNNEHLVLHLINCLFDNSASLCASV